MMPNTIPRYRFRRWLALAVLATLSLVGCKQYEFTEPTLRDQAAEFGADRPREKLGSRWGLSERAQQIEHNVGY
ncbi:MAG: hypothetical protein HYX69_16875 [Planctomycetia bacterium]|nr:hypothetical protein [Planctomycetia bacterium]